MSTTTKSSLTLAAAALASTLIMTSAASAAVQDEPVVVTAPRDDQSEKVVSHADLDLTIARDQRRLNWRVSRAVRDVCGVNDYYSARTLSNFSIYRDCSKAAWTDARQQMARAIAGAGERLARGGSGEVANTAILVSARAGDE